MVVRELITMLGYRVDNRYLNEYRGEFRRTAQQMRSVARGMMNIGARATLMISTPLVIAAKKMKDLGSAAIETENRFNVIFENVKDKANDAAKSFANDFDLAATTAKQAIGQTGDVLVGFGFSEEEALKFSDEINRVAGDFASFYDEEGGVIESSNRLTKGILGNIMNLRKYGVQIRQNTKEFKQQVRQMQASTGMTIQAAKTRVIFNEVLKQSKKSMGEYARTRHEFANRERKLREDQKEMFTEFGKIILPTLLKGVNILIKMTEAITDLSKSGKKIILFFGTLGIVIPPLIFALGSLLNSFAALSLYLHARGLIGLGLKAILGHFTPILFAAGKLLLIIAAISLAIDDIATWKRGGKSIMDEIFGDYESAITDIKNNFTDLRQFIVDLFTGDITGVVSSATRNIAGLANPLGSALFQNMTKKLASRVTPSQKEFMQQLMNKYGPSTAGVSGGSSAFQAGGISMPVTINTAAPADSAEAQRVIIDTITNTATQVAREFNSEPPLVQFVKKLIPEG